MSKKVELTEENYFSQEMSKKYCGSSQFKSFVGFPFMEGCEAKTMAEINGDYEREKTKSLLIGSYVDEMLTGTKESLQKFIENTPEMFYKNGSGKLLKDFELAEKMVERAKRDEFFMKTLKGEKQKIMVGNIHGLDFKIKVDNLGDNFITDLKTVQSVRETFYDATQGKRVSFVEWFGYITQGAIYQEIVRQNTGKTLPFFLSCISKEKEPDLAVIQIDNETLAERLESMKADCENIKLLKDGKVKPIRCENCEYCRKTKVLHKPISWLELGGELDA